MPVALISTRTSPAFGPSRSSSTISSGFFAANATAARVFMAQLQFLVVYPGRLCAQSESSALAHAGILRLLRGGRLVFVFGRTHPAHRVIGASAQIDVEVVHVT